MTAPIRVVRSAPRRAPARIRARALAFPLAVAIALAAGLAAQGAHHHHAASAATGVGVRVLHAEEERDLVIHIGPFALPDTGNTMQLAPAHAIVAPIDGWLTSFRARVVDDRGAPLPATVLHHVNVVRPDRRELFAPIMQRLVAAGQETGDIGIPFPFGVPVSAGDTLLVVAMVHNPTGHPLRATVEARLHYDTPAWLDRVDVQPFFLDVRPPPAGAAFDLPPGRSSFAWEGSPAIDVEVLGLGGHVHAHARELRLEELQPDGDAKVLWKTRPVFGSDGKVRVIPRKTFLLRLGLRLSRDRTYRIVAVYDNPTGQTIPGGGMGEIAGIVVPRASWPAPDPENPAFRADYRTFTRNNPALAERLHGAEGLD